MYMFTDEGTKKTSWGRRYNYNSHLPMYVSGNVYFNGAKPYKKEMKNCVDTKNKVYIKLVEENGHYKIDTNLYEFLPELDIEFVSTEMLGQAFEPEQKFENPDGSPIRIEEDYFGVRRSQHPTPGPFECAADLGRYLV